jgi:hypothetical protein
MDEYTEIYFLDDDDVRNAPRAPSQDDRSPSRTGGRVIAASPRSRSRTAVVARPARVVQAEPVQTARNRPFANLTTGQLVEHTPRCRRHRARRSTSRTRRRRASTSTRCSTSRSPSCARCCRRTRRRTSRPLRFTSRAWRPGAGRERALRAVRPRAVLRAEERAGLSRPCAGSRRGSQARRRGPTRRRSGPASRELFRAPPIVWVSGLPDRTGGSIQVPRDDGCRTPRVASHRRSRAFATRANRRRQHQEQPDPHSAAPS